MPSQEVIKYKGGTLRQRLSPNFLFLLLLFLLVVFTLPKTAMAQEEAVLSIGTVRRMGTEATVPIVIRNISNLDSGKFAVTAPRKGRSIYYHSIRFSPDFDGGIDSLFTSFSRISGGSLLIEFVSTDGAEIDIGTSTIGYITYKISAGLPHGRALTIGTYRVNFRNSQGSKIIVKQQAGRVERNRRLGDTEGKDSVTPLSAIRILQHISGRRSLAGSSVRRAVDLNASGNLDLIDVRMLLQYVVGLRNSFFTIKTTTLPPALLDSDYLYTLQTAHGNRPYTWAQVGGGLPAGLSLALDTGKISGKPTSKGEVTFTVRATDRDNNQVERQLTITVTESDIAEIDTIPPVTVEIGKVPVLPSRIRVTYHDGTTNRKDIDWGKIDTTSLGTKTISGDIGTTGLKVEVEITVIAKKPVGYIQYVTIDSSFHFPNLSSIWVTAIPEVSFVKISFVDITSGQPQATVVSMHYEGGNNFSRGITGLQAGSVITITAYDRFNNKLEEVEQAAP